MAVKKIEAVFFAVLWKNYVKRPVTTVDIDFGVDAPRGLKHSQTIFKMLSGLDYTEHHSRMDRMFPVVLLKENIPVEFITDLAVNITAVEALVGGEMQINKIEKFDFLLKHRRSITVKTPRGKGPYELKGPTPAAFLYHKEATFISRENKEKQAKDLYYMYFILRYAPDSNAILDEISQFSREGYFKSVSENLAKFFERVSSSGCLMIERENGPDEVIHDLRQDIFERFSKLREAL